MEILKFKLNETQTLIAYSTPRTIRPPGTHSSVIVGSEVAFKVGTNPEGDFIACSPDAAMALLAMLDRQEKVPTP